MWTCQSRPRRRSLILGIGLGSAGEQKLQCRRVSHLYGGYERRFAITDTQTGPGAVVQSSSIVAMSGWSFSIAAYRGLRSPLLMKFRLTCCFSSRS
jgi:hypothetical protein